MPRALESIIGQSIGFMFAHIEFRGSKNEEIFVGYDVPGVEFGDLDGR